MITSTYWAGDGRSVRNAPYPRRLVLSEYSIFAPDAFNGACYSAWRFFVYRPLSLRPHLRANSLLGTRNRRIVLE